MKENNKSNIIIVVVLLLMLAGIIYIPQYLKNARKNQNIVNFDIQKKNNYKPNEIIPVYVDDEQMSKIYFKDFLKKLIIDINDTYDLLDVDYRERVFENIYNYKSYIESLGILESSSVGKFATYERNNYKYYDIYDNRGNRFIFETNGVMQYKVYFDDIDEGEEE